MWGGVEPPEAVNWRSHPAKPLEDAVSHSATNIASLASDFAGELIEPDHPAFDEARKVFNGMHDKRPGLIARCTSSRDVQVALA